MEKVRYCFYKTIFKRKRKSKRYNCVYILSSKHNDRLMKAGVVAQFFYKINMSVDQVSFEMSIEC